MSSRVVIVVRHGEAASRADGGDHARPLTDRGVAQARSVGAWLAEQGVEADLVLCSTAVRAQQTGLELRRGGLAAHRFEADRRLYNAHVVDIVEVLREVGDDVATLVVVAHAPGIPDLAHLSRGDAGPDGGPDGGVGQLLGWPPAGLGVITHAGGWASFPDRATALTLVRDPSDG